MQDIIGKIVDWALDKNGIICLLSFVCGVILLPFIPQDIYGVFPFEEQVGSILIFAGSVALIFLVLKLLVFIITSVRKAIENNQNQRLIKEQRKNKNEMEIEKIRDFFDKVSDREYSLIMYLLSKERGTPYKEWGVIRSIGYGEYSIFNGKLFYSTTSHEKGPDEELVDINGNTTTLSTGNTANVYILRPEVYNELNYIINTYGSLSHYDRKTVPINIQNQNGGNINE